MLEAEQFSTQTLNSEAQASYAAAISSARSSGISHEHGLVCELAGYHYKKVCNFSSAWILFDQAKRCYAEWGCQMKVDSVTSQLGSLSDHMPSATVLSSSSSLSLAGGDGSHINTNHSSLKEIDDGGGSGGGMDNQATKRLLELA